MPAIGAALTAFGAAFGATTVGAFLTTNIIGKLLVTVAISALQTAMMPKPRAAGIKTGVTAAGGTNPCSFVLGRYATAGYAVCPPMSHGADEVENQFLTYVIELGSIAGQGLERLTIDGEYADIGGTAHPDYGTPVGGRFAGKAWVKYYDGSQTVADPMLIAKYGSYPDRPWSADMIGRGLCYVIATFSYDREVFNGTPKLRFEVSGIPLYDPRKDSTAGGSGAQRWGNPATWAGSDNPLVQVYNILRGISFADGTVWGGDAVAADLPADAWFAAMNACDVAVAISGGGTEPRWRTGFEVTVDEEPVTIIEELLKGCSGQLVDIGGVWKPRVGGPGLPVYFLDDDGIIINQPQDFDPFPPLDQCFNGIQASYPEPDSLWEAKDAPPRYSEALEAEDGGRRLVADLNLPAVPYKRQVQRVMKAYIKDERRMRSHPNLTLPPAAALIEPLDAIAWSSARNGYVAKVFEVSQVQEAPDTLLQTLSIKERNPADYDWEAADELPSSITAGKIVAAVAQPVPGWSVVAHTVYDAAGNPRKPALRLVWSANKLKAAVGLEWQIRLAGGGGAVVRRGSTQSVEDGDAVVTGGILPNTAYQARARAIMRRPRAWSAWVGATTPNLRTAKADLADDVTDYMAETATLAGIKPVSTLPAAGDKIDQIVMKIPEGVLYRWNGTAWTRTLFGGIKPGDVDIASFAASIRPTELFAALPTTGNFNGRIVYRTSDKSLWRHDGTSWINTNAADQIVGELIAGQIAAGAITARELAADSVAVRHLVVTDWANMVPNGAFSDGDDANDYWNAAGGGGAGRYFLAKTTNPTFVQTGAFSLLLQKADTATSASMSSKIKFPVSAGEWLYGETAIRTNEAASTGGAYIRIAFFDEVGVAVPYVDIASNIGTTSSWSTHTREFQVPVGAVMARAEAFHLASSNSRNLIIDRIIVKRMNGGELTIDGSLKARHMAAEVIISNVAQLGVAVVSTAAIGNAAITTAKISDAAITTAKIGNLQVDTLHIKNEAVTVTARAFKNSAITIVKAPIGSSSGGPAIDLTINRTAGLVTKVEWSGIISPNTTDDTKFAQVLFYITRDKGGVQTTFFDTYLTSNNRNDTFVSFSMVDTDTSGGTVTYLVGFGNTYHVNNSNCTVIKQVLEATQFKK